MISDSRIEFRDEDIFNCQIDGTRNRQDNEAEDEIERNHAMREKSGRIKIRRMSTEEDPGSGESPDFHS